MNDSPVDRDFNQYPPTIVELRAAVASLRYELRNRDMPELSDAATLLAWLVCEYLDSTE